eukprot:TRINITY_DN52174_c0_g1_i2.p1 TRINITY_DN52174_c0_g1~~TRINITY_DN52174_c0_g1_i2.p1  ORF type:complete len:326 (+),score=55.53 TRINITY_DN52174_c0_g1_i2:39-1016(+)
MSGFALWNCPAEKKFVKDALCEGERTDRRDFNSYRDISIMFGSNSGQVEVTMGTTRVVSVVSSEIVEPRQDKPTDGFLNFNVEFSPLADQVASRDHKQVDRLIIARLIDRTLRGSKAIDTEALCILGGKAVWSIRVDCKIVDNGGNLVDCCHLGSLAALMHYKRPEVTIQQGNKITLHSVDAKNPVPLSIHHVPVVVSVALLNNGELLFVDPSRQEEAVVEGVVVVGMNAHEEICVMEKSGGAAVAAECFAGVLELASTKAKELINLLTTELERDGEKQKEASMPLYAKRYYERKNQKRAGLPGEQAEMLQQLQEGEGVEVDDGD